jgi:hypothetical protein
MEIYGLICQPFDGASTSLRNQKAPKNPELFDAHNPRLLRGGDSTLMKPDTTIQTTDAPEYSICRLSGSTR